MKLKVIEANSENFVLYTSLIFERFTGLVPFKIQEHVFGIIDLFPIDAGWKDSPN